MKKIHWLTLLMGITLMVIAGFQLYWLNNNYEREKRSLEIRANMLFQEAVRDLQTEKLKLCGGNDSAGKMTIKMIVHDGEALQKQAQVKMFPKQQLVTMVNSFRRKINDSLHRTTQTNSAIVIAVDKNGNTPEFDTTKSFFDERTEPDGNHIVRLLYGVDSLQDTLSLPEIKKAYERILASEKLALPFSVVRLKDAGINEGPDLNEVTVGFAKPITYRLQLGNTNSYLLKRISMPFLFSLFLVGTTLLSFALLYRTLVKQQKLAVIKNEFISNITHELKTPIATVGVAIEALKNFNAIHDMEKTKEYLDISSNELQRLSLLVDKVLKLSMLEKKEIDIKHEPTDINTIVDEVVQSMRLQFEKCGATISVTGNGSGMLMADRLHLLSVLYNLLDNAIKYCSQKPVIEISTQELENDIQLTVADNGIGIAPEYRNRIFEKFFRVPTGNTHNAQGYGLGLSYVAHIVEQHHGTIRVESEVNKGTTFIIKLPKTNAG